MIDSITPTSIAKDVMRNQHQYAQLQEAKENESGYPYLRQILVLHHINQTDSWNDVSTKDLLIDT